jgi:hypothetical protein
MIYGFRREAAATSSFQVGAAGLALPDRRRSGPLGRQVATRSARPWGPYSKGPAQIGRRNTQRFAVFGDRAACAFDALLLEHF